MGAEWSSCSEIATSALAGQRVLALGFGKFRKHAARAAPGVSLKPKVGIAFGNLTPGVTGRAEDWTFRFLGDVAVFRRMEQKALARRTNEITLVSPADQWQRSNQRKAVRGPQHLAVMQLDPSAGVQLDRLVSSDARHVSLSKRQSNGHGGEHLTAVTSRYVTGSGEWFELRARPQGAAPVVI
jgi:hypothetical protein